MSTERKIIALGDYLKNNEREVTFDIDEDQNKFSIRVLVKRPSPHDQLKLSQFIALHRSELFDQVELFEQMKSLKAQDCLCEKVTDENKDKIELSNDPNCPIHGDKGLLKMLSDPEKVMALYELNLNMDALMIAACIYYPLDEKPTLTKVFDSLDDVVKKCDAKLFAELRDVVNSSKFIISEPEAKK